MTTTRPSPSELRTPITRRTHRCQIVDEAGQLGDLVVFDAAHALEILDDNTTVRILLGQHHGGRWVTVLREDAQLVVAAFDGYVPAGSIVLEGCGPEVVALVVDALLD